MNQLIYHYCSKEIFNKIIQSKEIWLSDISKMNDENEYKAGYQIIKDILKEKSLKQNIVTEMSDDNLNKSFQVLIGCFSRNDDMLSQWKAYADDGQGLSIGFNKETIMMHNLFNRFIENNMQPISNKVQFLDVNYNIEKFKKIVANTIDRFSQSTSPIWEKLLARELMMISISYKDLFFKEEDEVRAIITIENNIESKFNVESRETSYGKSNYHKLNTSYSDSSAIEKVTIGPKCDLSEEEVKQFLKKNNVNNIEVNTSEGYGKYR